MNGLAAVVTSAGPLGEEPGWRGYALPKLLENMRPAGASLVLGVVWTVWHWPLVFVPQWAGDGLSLPIFIPFYTITVISLAYIMTRLFQWSRGSVLMVIWVHGIANAIMPLMASGIWNKEGWSEFQDALFTATPIAIAALVLACFALTPFARARENAWRAAHPDAQADADAVDDPRPNGAGV